MKRKNSLVEQVRVDLDIEEHIDMQERGWRMQIVGLCALILLVFTAAIGLYGDGIISKKKIEQNNVTLEYQRFFRFEAQMEIGIKASPSGDVTVSFPADYLGHFEINAIVPAPKDNHFKKGHIEYVFAGGNNAAINFYVTPKDFGAIKGSVTVNDNLFSINHFIFP